MVFVIKRATTHFRSYVTTDKLCRDKVSLTLYRDKVSCVTTESQVLPTTRLGLAWRDVDSNLEHVTQPPGFMSRHGLPVSRQGSQACWVTWVVTKLFWALCRDLTWSRLGGLVS